MKRSKHKNGLRWKLRIFAIVGIFLTLLLVCGIASLFFLEIEDVVYAEGKIVSELPYEIVGHLDGRVVKFYCDEGDDVVAGQVIADIDAMKYEEEYASLNSELTRLYAELEVKKAELAATRHNPLPKELWNAETNLKQCRETAVKINNRMQRYLKLRRIGAISQKDYETTEIENINAQAELARAKDNYRKVKEGLGKVNITKAESDVKLVEAKIEGCRISLKLAARHIADCRLVAPASGRIVNMPAKYTMFVQKGKTAVKLAAGQNLHGVAYVSESVVRKVRSGQPVRVSSDVFNRLEFGSFSGKVNRIQDVPEGNESSASALYPVEIKIDPRGRPLKLGSSAEFAIVTGHEPVIYALMGIKREDFKSLSHMNIKYNSPANFNDNAARKPVGAIVAGVRTTDGVITASNSAPRSTAEAGKISPSSALSRDYSGYVATEYPQDVQSQSQKSE